MQNKPLKVAIIGFGRQGQSHYLAFKHLETQNLIHIVGICDLNKPVDLPKKTAFFTKYKDLLRYIEIDLVVVSTPNYLHKQICAAALKLGIHVFKEKPLAITYQDGIFLHQLAKEHNCFLITAQQRYHLPAFLKAKELVPQLGQIKRFSYHFSLEDFSHSWYWDITKAGGGVWLNMGWHALIMIDWLLGGIVSVRLSSNSGGKRPWQYNTDHTAFARVKLTHEGEGSLFVSCVQPKQESLKIEGSKGKIYLQRDCVRLVIGSQQQTFLYKKIDLYLVQAKAVLEQLRTSALNSDRELRIISLIQTPTNSSTERNNHVI